MLTSRWWLLLCALSVAWSTHSRAVIDGDTWFPLGPAPIVDFFGSSSGRASAIAVNPLRLDELWIGTAAGGVWHSIDGGQNWTPIADKQPALAIGSIAVDGCTTAGCTKIYAGTGENAIRRDTYYGRGLLVLDTQARDPAWVVRSGEPLDFGLGSIVDVILDPETSGKSKRVFVALSSGNTSSASQTTLTIPEPPAGYGLFRSDDDGASWVKLTVPGAEGARPTDLKMHPVDSSILYAGFLGVGLYKSIDSGATWCPLNQGIALPPGCPVPSGLAPTVPGGFDHVEIALHRAGPDTLYVTFGHCADPLIQSCQPSLFRTTDGGETWTRQRQGSTSGSNTCARVFSRYTHALAVHPTLPDVIHLGGVRLCRSTNAGISLSLAENNLQPDGTGADNIIHVDHREVLYHPLDSNRVYNTNDGGFTYSTNGGIDWTPGNADLQITGFYSLTSSPNTPRILGGSQDNSGQLWSGFRGWAHVSAGDGGYAVIDRDDPLIMYMGFNFGRVFRSVDGGLNFSTVVTPPGANSGNAAFNAPLVQDETSPHALYYGNNQVHRSVDDASSWEVISPILATGATDEITPGQNVVTALAARGDRVYVGYYGGEVFTTNSACTSSSCWPNVTPPLPAAPVTDMVIDPQDDEIAWVAYSGFEASPRVYRTTNAGKSWSAAAQGLPAGVPVNALAVEADGTLWAGLDSGPDAQRSNVYRSRDGGGTWQAKAGGLPNAPVHDLSVDDSRSRIYVGMHGRGAYALGAANVGTYEGRVDGALVDVPVYGTGLPANRSCTLRLLQQTGDVCASGNVDVLGAEIRTLPSGQLVSRNGAAWNGKLVAWACFDGRCVGDTPISQCQGDADGDGDNDPLSSVVVDCGGTPGVANIVGSPSLSNPPGSLIDIGFFEASRDPRGRPQPHASKRLAASPADIRFEVSAHLPSRSAKALCSVSLQSRAGSDARQVLMSSRNALNSSDACREADVVAAVTKPLDRELEDVIERRRCAVIRLSPAYALRRARSRRAPACRCADWAFLF